MENCDHTNVWAARARREAAAILSEAFPDSQPEQYQAIVGLVAIGWIQGVTFGTHFTLEKVQQGFDELRDETAA